jgi:hypothetical protein
MASVHRPRLSVIQGGLSLGDHRPGESRRRWRRAEGSLAGYCVAAAGTAVAVAAGGTRHPVGALAVLALAVVIAAGRMTLTAALASGAICWLFWDGFVIGRHGDLVWHGPFVAWSLLVLGAAALSGFVLGRMRHRG